MDTPQKTSRWDKSKSATQMAEAGMALDAKSEKRLALEKELEYVSHLQAQMQRAVENGRSAEIDGIPLKARDNFIVFARDLESACFELKKEIIHKLKALEA